MTNVQLYISMLLLAAGILLTRAVPFLLFPTGKQTPGFVQYLGRVLPAAVFGLLIVFCLKNVSLVSGSRGIPEAIGIAAVVLLHLWRKQLLLSVAGGTVVYMLLVQLVF